MKLNVLYIVFIGFCLNLSAQQKGYWQQHVDYTMDIDVDAKKYQYKGSKNWCIPIILLTN